MTSTRQTFYRLLCLIMLVALSTTTGAAQTQPPEIIWSQITSDYAEDIAWSPDGRYIAVGKPREIEIQIFDWQTGQQLWSYTFADDTRSGYPFQVAWSPNGRYIAGVVHGLVYILEFPSQRRLEAVEALYPLSDVTGEIEFYAWSHVEWSADSNRLAALNGIGYIYIAALEAEEVTQIIDFPLVPNLRGEGIFYSIFAWSPNGLWFATPHYIPKIPLVLSIGYWDQHGQFMADSEAEGGMPLTCYPFGHRLEQVQSLAWANDSRTLAVDGSYGRGICRLTVDGTIERTWLPLSGPPDRNMSPTSFVAWSPDQRWLASSLSSFHCIYRIDQPFPDPLVYENRLSNDEDCGIRGMAWSPDSRYLALATTIGLWVGRLDTP